MNLDEILKISASILATLGGGSLIVFGLSSWLGKVWANRLMEKDKSKFLTDLENLKNGLVNETESYKIKLKKSEFLFEKEYEATSELTAIIRSFLPPLRDQNMDWYDACDEIAQSFPRINKSIDKFLSSHGAILNDEQKDLLTECVGLASYYSHETQQNEVSKDANGAAEKVYSNLLKAEKSLVKQVHSQVST
ncbi:hypothetical protein A9267_14595 [Shewanella sp. UCD-FRSSP16_17]|uniref:hypothetical protein n=1 Tax=Shewanella sp. UCD-FRSSP16_17 TaxID=1853256 RepID=UPI0007EEAEA9|nr:hypothetical protein [Shewanella sp. UCD-FRSSP16_17]OBT07094.1 hypothetical protein A9267_14595 [Shewanella sp. UCD-FRSSP16_17]